MIDVYTQCRMRMSQNDLADTVAASCVVQDAIDRGLDLTTRLSSVYKPEDKVSDEVLNYIKDYEDICSMFDADRINFDISIESAWDIVKRIVTELWRFICKLWDNIQHGFRYLFSAQYRASSKAIKYRQMIALCGSSDEASEKFTRYEVEAFVTPDEMKSLINSTDNLITLLTSVVDTESAEEIDTLLKRSANGAGVEFQDNKFTDKFNDLAFKEGTYGSLGWDIKLADTISQDYIKVTGRAVKLKNIEKSIANDIADLKRELNKQVASGADSLSETQKKLAYKSKLLTVIQAGQLTLIGRINALDSLWQDLATDADDIANGRIDAGE